MLRSVYVLVIGIVFWFVYFLLYARFVFQWFRAPFVNQIAQWVYRSTNPVLRPLDRYIPSWRQAGLSALVLMLLAAVLKALCLSGLQAFTPAGLVLALLDAVSFALWFWIWAVGFYVILSWLFSLVEARRGNDFVALVYLLGPAPCKWLKQRVRTNVGPIDFAPMIVIFVLMLVNMLLYGLASEFLLGPFAGP